MAQRAQQVALVTEDITTVLFKFMTSQAKSMDQIK